jgi:hypothetical protein
LALHPHPFPDTVWVLFSPASVQETQALVDVDTNEFVGSGHSQISNSELKTKLLLHLQDVEVLTYPVLFLFLRVVHTKHRSLIKIELGGH